jgi:hypothetical protein
VAFAFPSPAHHLKVKTLLIHLPGSTGNGNQRNFSFDVESPGNNKNTDRTVSLLFSLAILVFRGIQIGTRCFVGANKL